MPNHAAKKMRKRSKRSIIIFSPAFTEGCFGCTHPLFAFYFLLLCFAAIPSFFDAFQPGLRAFGAGAGIFGLHLHGRLVPLRLIDLVQQLLCKGVVLCRYTCDTSHENY